ncbi:unnamed protein product [Rhizophagus irregularis]|uniref:Uncharacterized protein n=1 Tax=Rhizophagus irregularis TaxID=588596 RepID=A0A2N1MBT4_9GLOM|nr:hypothetical protein RhiirC2_871367 [Rhizophagus irregularis]CAB4375512.1 unnamed protein product [Rhizophagus irregularis]CAB5389646.1 unnamed protein product [Rhizophagus irregularis]
MSDTSDEVWNLDLLPDDSRTLNKDEYSVTITNNSSDTASGITRIYRQACSEEGREMKKAGGLVPAISNSNPVKWVSESAHYASQHHNTNSTENQNVYRFEVDSKRYEEDIRNQSLEKTTFNAKSARHWEKQHENFDELNYWDQQGKEYTRNKVGQPPPEGKVNIGIRDGNIAKFNDTVEYGVKKLSRQAEDNASNWIPSEEAFTTS